MTSHNLTLYQIKVNTDVFYFSQTFMSSLLRDKANEMVHTLAREIIFLASLHTFVDESTCIIELISNEML